MYIVFNFYKALHNCAVKKSFPLDGGIICLSSNYFTSIGAYQTWSDFTSEQEEITDHNKTTFINYIRHTNITHNNINITIDGMSNEWYCYCCGKLKINWSRNVSEQWAKMKQLNQKKEAG